MIKVFYFTMNWIILLFNLNLWVPNLLPSYATCSKQSKNQCVNTESSEKSQRNVNFQILWRKHAREKWQCEVLQAKRSTNEHGHFPLRVFSCTNFLNIQFLCDFCLNSAFTKFHLALFCAKIWKPIFSVLNFYWWGIKFHQ